jgi:hypothetical protein
MIPSPSANSSPVTPFLGLLDPKDNDTKILRNVGRSLETSANYRFSEWSWFLLLLHRAVKLFLLLDCMVVKLKAQRSFETSVMFRQWTRVASWKTRIFRNRDIFAVHLPSTLFCSWHMSVKSVTGHMSLWYRDLTETDSAPAFGADLETTGFKTLHFMLLHKLVLN